METSATCHSRPSSMLVHCCDRSRIHVALDATSCSRASSCERLHSSRPSHLLYRHASRLIAVSINHIRRVSQWRLYCHAATTTHPYTDVRHTKNLLQKSHTRHDQTTLLNKITKYILTRFALASPRSRTWALVPIHSMIFRLNRVAAVAVVIAWNSTSKLD